MKSNPLEAESARQQILSQGTNYVKRIYGAKNSLDNISNKKEEVKMRTDLKRIIPSLILAIALLAGPSVTMGETKDTSPCNCFQKEMMAKKMMAGKTKGFRHRMGMMDEKNGMFMAMMGCKGMAGCMLLKRMSDEQRQRFLDDTVALRRQMMERRFDYLEALRHPDTSPKDLALIEKDMLNLRLKMLDKLIDSSPK